MASQRSGSSSPSSGDRYNSETARASCWSSRTWHTDGNLGLRAEDAAPRSFAPRDSGRPKRVRTRREVRLVGPALCRLLYNPAKEPTQGSQTSLDRSAPRLHAVLVPASRSASNSIAPRAASASLGTASAPSFRCFRPTPCLLTVKLKALNRNNTVVSCHAIFQEYLKIAMTGGDGRRTGGQPKTWHRCVVEGLSQGVSSHRGVHGTLPVGVWS